jgi:hypothetical protein
MVSNRVKATSMMKAVTTKRNFGNATRWLMTAAAVLSLSSLQLTWASVASICEAASQPESCRCSHACEPTGPMHHQPANKPSARPALHSPMIEVNSGAPGPSDFSCCRALPQGDRPVVTISTHEIAVEIETTSLTAAAAPVALASIRVHDPPDARPLYLTNSCLLI